MTEKTARPSVRIEDPETLALCRSLMDLRREANDMTEKLNARYRDEADAMNTAFENRSKELWDQLYAKAGIDPDRDWTLDAEYMDAHGVAFVKESEPAPQRGGLPAGLAALLGGGGELHIVGEDEGELEPAPTLN